jgi:hypothetical protein
MNPHEASSIHPADVLSKRLHDTILPFIKALSPVSAYSAKNPEAAPIAMYLIEPCFRLDCVFGQARFGRSRITANALRSSSALLKRYSDEHDMNLAFSISVQRNDYFILATHTRTLLRFFALASDIRYALTTLDALPFN